MRLRGHKGEFLLDTVFDALGVDDQTAENVVHENKEGISTQEHFRNVNTTNGRVVKSTLHPLRSIGGNEVGVKVCKTAAQRGQTFRSHGVTLVGHGGRTDLVFFKGLFDFLPTGKMSNVGRDALASGAEIADGAADFEIDLARVGLGGDRVACGETGLLGDELVKSLDLCVVTVEDLEERGLGTGGSLDTAEAELMTNSLDGAEIHQQILEPDAGSLSDCGQLSGLQVGESETGLILPLHGKGGEFVNSSGHLSEKHVKTITHKNEVGIVGDVARGGTPVDDTSSGRSTKTVSVNPSHDIVSGLSRSAF
jgi:hypothetical protein